MRRSKLQPTKWPAAVNRAGYRLTDSGGRSVVVSLGGLVTEAGELDKTSEEGGGNHGLNVHRFFLT